MKRRKTIVIHHAPDLDAIGGVWLFTRFLSQEFASAKVLFVNSGDSLSDSEIAKNKLDPNDIYHVDTGKGPLDHHTPEKSGKDICATSLVFDYIQNRHLEISQDKALKSIIDFITQVDHFGEVYWPDATNARYSFMIHELIRGQELADQHSDDQQLQFGLQCLDNAYNVLVQQHKAAEILDSQGTVFSIRAGKCLAISSKNDDVIKLAQKRGISMVIKKDPTLGSVRIKARPDSQINLDKLYTAILAQDTIGSWYNHPSGKMLINSSRKMTAQKPTPLSLETIIDLVKEHYG
jgi:hypothetical protein